MIDNTIGKIIGSGKKIGGKNDWDYDGIVNSKDCQPLNTMRQDKMSTAARAIKARSVKVNQSPRKTIRYTSPVSSKIRYTSPVSSKPTRKSYPNTLPVHPDLKRTTKPLMQRPDGRIEIYQKQSYGEWLRAKGS